MFEEPFLLLLCSHDEPLEHQQQVLRWAKERGMRADPFTDRVPLWDICRAVSLQPPERAHDLRELLQTLRWHKPDEVALVHCDARRGHFELAKLDGVTMNATEEEFLQGMRKAFGAPNWTPVVLQGGKANRPPP